MGNWFAAVIGIYQSCVWQLFLLSRCQPSMSTTKTCASQDIEKQPNAYDEDCWYLGDYESVLFASLFPTNVCMYVFRYVSNIFSFSFAAWRTTSFRAISFSLHNFHLNSVNSQSCKCVYAGFNNTTSTKYLQLLIFLFLYLILKNTTRLWQVVAALMT